MQGIVVNGKVTNVPDDVTSILALVSHLNLAEERVALELNGTVVPRKAWSITGINQNDRIEIVHFVGGG